MPLIHGNTTSGAAVVQTVSRPVQSRASPMAQGFGWLCTKQRMWCCSGPAAWGQRASCSGPQHVASCNGSHAVPHLCDSEARGSGAAFPANTSPGRQSSSTPGQSCQPHWFTLQTTHFSEQPHFTHLCSLSQHLMISFWLDCSQSCKETEQL